MMTIGESERESEEYEGTSFGERGEQVGKIVGKGRED